VELFIHFPIRFHGVVLSEAQGLLCLHLILLFYFHDSIDRVIFILLKTHE
jgi:hypothetical protein